RLRIGTNQRSVLPFRRLGVDLQSVTSWPLAISCSECRQSTSRIQLKNSVTRSNTMPWLLLILLAPPLSSMPRAAALWASVPRLVATANTVDTVDGTEQLSSSTEDGEVKSLGPEVDEAGEVKARFLRPVLDRLN